MRPSFRTLPHHRKLLVLVVVLCAAVAAAFGARAWMTAAAADRLGPARVEAEVIALTPRGCEPAEITRPRGRFLLYVRNLTGQPLADIELIREGGGGSPRLDSLPGRRRRPSWSKLVDPPPGRYLLRPTEYPELVCHVTITDR